MTDITYDSLPIETRQILEAMRDGFAKNAPTPRTPMPTGYREQVAQRLFEKTLEEVKEKKFAMPQELAAAVAKTFVANITSHTINAIKDREKVRSFTP